MKKWWLHTLACILNGIVVTINLIIFLYFSLTSNSDASAKYGTVLISLAVYAIFITSDIWGLKLYYCVKNKEQLSLKDKQAIRPILFFLGTLLVVLGFGLYPLIPGILRGLKNFQTFIFDDATQITFSILTVSVTSVIVFIGYIFLLLKIKKINTIQKEEINNIGELDL